MRITNPEINVILFSNEDVIATSGAIGTLFSDRLFYIPFAEYGGTVSGSGAYVEFRGDFTNNGSGSYLISNINSAQAVPESDVTNLTTPGHAYLPDVGITINSNAMAPIAAQAYTASYSNGSYYTNGVSYYDQYGWQ